MTSETKRWPGESDEAHPEIFTTIPPQPKEKKPGQLSEAAVKQFFELGYVVVEDFFDKKDLDACREAIKLEVDNLANKMLKAGKLSRSYEEYGLFERLTHIEKEFPGSIILLHKMGKLPQAFRALWSNERLLNAIEQLIGPDIKGHPVWNLRTKTPQAEAATVPWHQDAAYLDDDAYKVLQPTAWIPLLDANETNGCLQMAERGHRTGKVAQHTCCSGNTWYINLDEAEMAKTLGVDLKKDIKTLPVKYGGMALFNNLIPHRSLQNFSDKIRWSLDLRWQTPFKPSGFHGVLEGITFRSSKDPDLKIDWDGFDDVNRHQKALNTPKEKLDEWDTRLGGPWMLRWEITHPNRHTEAFINNLTGWGKA